MLTISQLEKAYGPKILFQNLSFRLQAGERVGLVGPNGAGKTTLFSIILGTEEADGGRVDLERGTSIGFLPQESAPVGGETVTELAASVTPELTELYQTLRAHPDPEDPEHLAAMERFVELEGHELEARAKRILAGLAFRPEDFGSPAHRLSGGWIMRAHLARLLVMAPDILMLDEPTNHLDLETLGWFQERLKNHPGAVLTISHDRGFLNSICDSIAEIGPRGLTVYKGNYEDYLRQKEERQQLQEAAYKNQQREIARHEAFINRFRAQANKASQVQARIKQLEKMERIDPPEPGPRTITFDFPQPSRSGQRVATLTGVRQAYGERTIYENLDLAVEKGQRSVLVGPNGAGKSTLLKILAGQVPIQAGSRELGHNVGVGYYSQQRVDGLTPENRVLEEASEKTADGVSPQKVRDILGAFLFRGDDVFKPVHVLSGGEKSRLALVKLLLNPPNLLLLDEPTTHLDMPSIEALIGALKGFTGTLLFVSHDVHFIRSIATTTLRVESGALTVYAGDYDYYLRKSGAASGQSGLVEGLRDNRADRAAEKSGKEKGISAKERRRIRAEERKAENKRRKDVQKRVAALEAEIEALEREQAALTRDFEDPGGAGDPETARERGVQAARLAKRIEEKNYEWEIAASELEHLEAV